MGSFMICEKAHFLTNVHSCVRWRCDLFFSNILSLKTCQLNQCRYKFRGSKPRPSILERRVMEEITKPFYPEQLTEDLSLTCSIIKYRKQETFGNRALSIKDNKYEQFLKKEAHKILSNSFLVALCQLDSFDIRRLTVINNLFLDNSLHLVVFPENIMRKCLMETKYKNLSDLMTLHTALIVSTEDNVPKMIRTFKKLPDVHLLGGAVGETLLTKQGMINYANLPSSEHLLGTLISNINSPIRTTCSLLSSHQRRLSNLFYNILQTKS
ncbi:hypothetical protein HELRODRAFT_190136 [Helobdella robusta]|uniref:Large ribosomal subunit protein uL10m n=1 Tax=Helobdella robusta TaxID=6412 RepID=T1FRQ2_HELRO|nr:hypothetical protein HELRODRAFT_190136 [Helobdella robusta]ESO10690.1 hypothetical protein HELRODRAFT_190136 [Helobdella robusta]